MPKLSSLYRLKFITKKKRVVLIIGHKKERENQYGEYRELTNNMHLRRNTLYAIQQAVSRSFHIAGVFSAKFYILSLFFKIKTTTKTSGFMISLPLVHKNVINCPEVTKPSKFLAKVVILSTLRARELLKIKEYILKFTPVLKK